MTMQVIDSIYGITGVARTTAGRWPGLATALGMLATAMFLFGAPLDQAHGQQTEAQPMRFEGFGQAEGLSQNTVLSIVQDASGFMWFGTENGLNRYDGYTFTAFRRETMNPGSLTSDFVFDVAEGPNGDLWIATDGGGLALRRKETGNFRVYRHDPALTGSLASNNIRAVSMAEDGVLWVGHQRAGLDRFEVASGRITHFRHNPADPASLNSDSVFAVHVDRAGEVWVGTDAGLNRLNPASGRVTRYQHDPSIAGSLSNDLVRTIVADEAGTLWIGTKGGGLNRFDPETERFTVFRNDPADPRSLSNDRVWALLEDDSGRFWVGTSAGLNLFDRATGDFQRYHRETTDADSLGDDHVRSLFQDRSGMLWVGTQHAGVFKWNPRSWSMGHVKPTATNDGLSAGNVMAFAESTDGTLWVGTFGGGLNAIDSATGKVRRLQHDPALAESLGDDRVMSLAIGKNGHLWIGTMTDGLNRLDPNTGRILRYRHDAEDPASLAANGIMALFADREGRLWIGTFGAGVDRLDNDGSGFVHFPHDPADPTSLSSPRATSFAQDASGAVWIGTDGGGLNRWDPVTGNFDVFRHNPLDQSSLSADTVYSLYVDADNQVWVGTRGGGLDRVLISPRHPGLVRFSNYSQVDGLSNDVIYGIQGDDLGNLWLSTNFGLNRFNPTTGEVKRFHRSHGLQAEEFNFGAHFRSRDGELFFGGANGFNHFYPGSLPLNATAPSLKLTGFDVLNKPVATEQPYQLLDAVELGYRDDVLTLEFAALDFTAPAENQYQYLLEGFDQAWVDAGNRRRVTYTNLAAGSYVFRAKASNSDGVWSEDELRLSVTVAPSPWESPAAYFAYAVAALLLVLWIWMAQRRRMLRKEAYSRQLEAEVDARTQELAERNEELRSVNGQLAEASLTDPLTGLRNRRYLYEEASKDVDLVRRRYQESTAATGKPRTTDMVFLMVDLDHFKPINDSHGHAAGDEVLLQVRDTLRHAARSSDLIIRWGGDEFLVIARHTDADEAEELAERIRSRIEDRIMVLDDGTVVKTTCSVGFACFPFLREEPGRLAWEQVMAVADRAMYMAKESRNAWVGLVGTPETPEVEDLFKSIEVDPDLMVEAGTLQLRSSEPRQMATCA